LGSCPYVDAKRRERSAALAADKDGTETGLGQNFGDLRALSP
jgi:hypothetical protein